MIFKDGEKIEIEKVEFGWKVTCGCRWEESLDSGEALWVVANLLSGQEGPFLKNKEEHDAWDKKYRPEEYAKRYPTETRDVPLLPVHRPETVQD